LAGFIVAAAVSTAIAKDAPAPQLDANAVTTDAKLSATVNKALVQIISDYNSRRYDAALSDLANARNIARRSAYDDFQINKVAVGVALVRSDYDSGAAAAEAMASSLVLTEKDRKAVYDDALLMNAGARHYWRAIQFGALLDREGLLDAVTSDSLAKTYLAYGSYADGERVDEAALARGFGDADQRKALSETLADLQIKEGKREPSFGQGLMNALVAGAVAGIAQGLTGQQVNNQPANAEQRQASAQDAEREAQQRAASELLLQDVTSLRKVYPDLAGQAARLSPADRKRAERIMQSASDAYGREDYSAAQSSLHDVLAIDATNGTANYYYADCLARGPNDSLTAIEFLARALAFDRDGEARSLAREALQGIASSSQGATQN
jgi:hypothetical protein